jgi:hypothetical protein
LKAVWDLAGQDNVVALLRGSIERDRVAHAYLFSGPPGAPLVDGAMLFAMALNCTSPLGSRGEPCMECDQCAKIAARIHPDYIVLEREGAAQIVPIEVVRNQVLARIGLPPHEANTRVYVVEEATAMAPPAANCLLKTLEEPPARSVFVLCTTAPEQLLPTIRSRCQRVRFGGAGVGGGFGANMDETRAAKIASLGDELAADRHELGLPARIAEGKGDTAPVLIAAARKLHGEARAAAAANDGERAARASARAQAILAWHTAVAIHNANPQLAVEAVIVQLDQLAPVTNNV